MMIRFRPPFRRRVRPPRSLRPVEDRYAAHISRQLSLVLGRVQRDVLLHVPDWQETARGEVLGRRADAGEFEAIIMMFRSIRLSIFERETGWAAQMRMALQQLAEAVNGQNKAHIKDVLQRVLRVDPIQTEPWLEPLSRNWIAENVTLVTSVSDEMLTDLERVIFKTVREGISYKDMRKEIEAKYQLSKSRSQLIARDQVSKYNASLTWARQANLGITRYWWRDSRDARVRPMHRHLADESERGKMYEWAKPPVTNKAGDHNHPGQDYQCRCWADPVFPGEET